MSNFYITNSYRTRATLFYSHLFPAHHRAKSTHEPRRTPTENVPPPHGNVITMKPINPTKTPSTKTLLALGTLTLLALLLLPVATAETTCHYDTETEWETGSPTPPTTLDNNVEVKFTTDTPDGSTGLKYDPLGDAGGQYDAITYTIDLTDREELEIHTRKDIHNARNLIIKIGGTTVYDSGSTHAWTQRTFDIATFDGETPVELGVEGSSGSGEWEWTAGFALMEAFCVPSHPQNLDATTGIAPGEIDLAWDPPEHEGDSSIINYNIYRSTTSGGPYTQFDQVTDTTTYTDRGLATGVYHYVVTATNDHGESPQSNEAAAPAIGVLDPIDPPTLNVSDEGVNTTLPAQRTPTIPAQNITTAPINTPPTCEENPCHEETTILPGQDESTPTITVPEQCTPFGTLCIGPFDIHGQNVSTDPVTAPPVCNTAQEVCLGPVTLVPGQNETTPEIPSQQLTPPVTVSAFVTNTTADIDQIGETEPIGPTTITVPGTPLTSPIPITVCADPSPLCQQPVMPTITAQTHLELYLQAGDEAHKVTVPVNTEE